MKRKRKRGLAGGEEGYEQSQSMGRRVNERKPSGDRFRHYIHWGSPGHSTYVAMHPSPWAHGSLILRDDVVKTGGRPWSIPL